MNAEEVIQIGYELFEKEQMMNRYSKRYIQRNLKNTRDFIKYLYEHGQTDIRIISKQDIIAYFNYLKEKPNQKKEGTLSLDTIRGMLSSINLYYSALYKNMLIAKNPFHGLQLNQHHNKEWKRKPLTTSEMEKFLENIKTNTPKGLRDRTIFELIYSSGLRACEITNLKICDINFEQREMIVRGKLGTDRMVPISEVATKFLILYLGKRIYQSEFPVFPGETFNKGINSNYLGSLFKNYLNKNEMHLEGVSIHSIRHSTATHLLDNGASIRHVQELLGHKNIKTTERYTHVQTDKVGRIYRKYHPREHELFDAVDEKYLDDVKCFINLKLTRKTVKKEPAENLKRLRYTAGISRKQLAEIIGVSYGTVSNYECAKCSITTERAVALSNLFNVDKEIFL